MSSPIGRTCCQGAAAAVISIVPSPRSWMSSIMITASVFGGMASPVSIQMASASSLRWRGEVSAAPTVLAAETATPSMAAAGKCGLDRAAQTGAAVTWPRAWSSGSLRVRRGGQPGSSASALARRSRAVARGTS